MKAVFKCDQPCNGGDPCFQHCEKRPTRCGNGRFTRWVYASTEEAESLRGVLW